MQFAEPTYYLETNALRGLGKKILRLEPSRKYRTSVLSLLELISSASSSERDFSICKGCLGNLLTLKFEVDFAFPEKKIADTFEFFKHIEKRQGDLQEVIKGILQASDLASCKELLGTKNLTYGMEHFREYDENFGRQFIEASIAGCREIKKAFESKESHGGAVFEASELALPFREFCKVFATKYSELNRSASVWAFSTQLSTWLDENPTEELVGKVYQSYNGNLDRFIDAFSYYTMIQAGKMNQPGRNDFLDLFHFSYVEQGDIFVTDDKDILSICHDLNLCSTQSPASLPLIASG